MTGAPKLPTQTQKRSHRWANVRRAKHEAERKKKPIGPRPFSARPATSSTTMFYMLLVAFFGYA